VVRVFQLTGFGLCLLRSDTGRNRQHVASRLQQQVIGQPPHLRRVLSLVRRQAASSPPVPVYHSKAHHPKGERFTRSHPNPSLVVACELIFAVNGRRAPRC